MKYYLNTLLALLIGVLLLVYVVFGILFPKFEFRYEGKKNDSIYFRNLNGKKYLQVKYNKGYPFANIKMKVVGGDLSDNDIFGRVYQDEIGLYADGEPITSLEELKKILHMRIYNKGAEQREVFDGELVSSGEAVYYVSDGEYRAFVDAETFEKFGLDWNKVRPAIDGELADLKKGKKITSLASTAYLPHSFVSVSGDLFWVYDGIRRKIVDNKAIDFVRTNYSIIKIDKEKIRPVGEIFCKMGNKREVECELDKFEGVIIFPRAEILLEMKKDVKIDEVIMKVTTFDGFNSVVPKIAINNLKKIIKNRYGSEIELFLSKI